MKKQLTTKKKTVQGTCNALGCSNHAQGAFCSTHRRAKQRLVNTLMYCYGNLKQNARRRGISFSLTLQQFRAFCDKTGYLALRGRKGSALTIDRINPDEGYTIKNIQAIPLRANVAKMWQDKQHRSLPVPPIDINGIVQPKRRAAGPAPF